MKNLIKSYILHAAAVSVLAISSCSKLDPKWEAPNSIAPNQAGGAPTAPSIAAVYEQEAEGDRAAAERHRGLARAYERGYIAGGSRVRGSSTARRENKSLAAHCENLTRIYQQAVEENLALAKEHRQLATETKN